MRWKNIIVLCFAIIVFSAFAFAGYYTFLLEYRLTDTPVFDHFNFRVYKLDAGIACCGVENNKNISRIDYSESRAAKLMVKWKPVRVMNPEALLNMALDDVIAKYGAPHVDLGSCFFMPSYLTDDAHLIMMRVSAEDIIIYVSVMDLFTGNEIVRYEA